MCETKTALQRYVDEAWRQAKECGRSEAVRLMQPDMQLIEYREFHMRQIAEAFMLPAHLVRQ